MMRTYSFAASLVALASCLAGCGSRLIGADASFTPENRDQAQRQMPRPPIERDAPFETVTVQTDIEAPAAQVTGWFGDKGAAAFSSFGGTIAVSGVSRIEALSGNWSKPGDRRRLVYADGSSAIEEITDRQPDLLRYEVWNATNDTGRYTSYALGEVEFTATGQTTHVRWTYSFRPKRWPDGWFIRSYVQDDFRQYMEGTLIDVRAAALTELAAKPTRPSKG
jgi:hypothetical protein